MIREEFIKLGGELKSTEVKKDNGKMEQILN